MVAGTSKSMNANKTGKIVIVGSTSGAGTAVDAFASSIAEAVRRAPDLTLAGVVGPEPPFPTSAGLVLGLTAPNDRVGVVKNAVSANLPVVTLPLPDGAETVRTTVHSGRVAQISPLCGFPSLQTLRAQVRQGALGRPYGVFATHRVRQGRARVFSEVGISLLHYVHEVLGSPVTRVQVTRAALFGAQPDSWFVIARAANNVITTVEFAASLPREGGADEQILVEATGSDTVLRAEPTRVAISVTGRNGATTERGWWSESEYAQTFIAASLDALREHDAAREESFLRLVAAVRESADSGAPVEIG